MGFIKANILSITGVVLYSIWWLYLIFVFGEKQYDNGFAGALASEAIAGLTIVIILFLLTCFLWAAFKTRNWKKYVAFAAVILTPVVIIILYVSYNVDKYKPSTEKLISVLSPNN